MRYLMIHRIAEDVTLGSEQEARHVADQAAWDAEMDDRGILISGGRLRPDSDATTVRLRSGELLVSDGPFAETKEQIAGYAVLECATMDEAIEVSGRHPTGRIGTFELRPFG
jgi:hypothetical protein